jgi:hypothetical protein
MGPSEIVAPGEFHGVNMEHRAEGIGHREEGRRKILDWRLQIADLKKA